MDIPLLEYTPQSLVRPGLPDILLTKFKPVTQDFLQKQRLYIIAAEIMTIPATRILGTCQKRASEALLQSCLLNPCSFHSYSFIRQFSSTLAISTLLVGSLSLAQPQLVLLLLNASITTFSLLKSGQSPVSLQKLHMGAAEAHPLPLGSCELTSSDLRAVRISFRPLVY